MNPAPVNSNTGLSSVSPEPTNSRLIELLETLSKMRQVRATRDGDTFEALFAAGPDEHNAAIRLAAKAFSIHDMLEDNAAGDTLEERLDFAEGDMDTFEIEPVAITLDPARLLAAIKQHETLSYVECTIVQLEKSFQITD